jgi:hypothetical protein
VKVAQEGVGSLRGAVGTPDQIRELVSRYEAAGVDQIIFVLQAGPNRHEHILEALELFGADVLPEFAERADAADRAVDERLAPAIERALARRAPARESDPSYVVKPNEGGVPGDAGVVSSLGTGGDAGSGNGSRGLGARLTQAGEEAFGRFVRSSGDRRLERTVGSDPGLRVLFGGMAQRFRPDRALGWTGEILYELRTEDGTLKPWTVEIARDHARARPGRTPDPAVTLRVGLADFVRIAGRDLEPGRALVTGRMEIEGDVNVATRLGEMFGEPSAY